MKVIAILFSVAVVALAFGQNPKLTPARLHERAAGNPDPAAYAVRTTSESNGVLAVVFGETYSLHAQVVANATNAIALTNVVCQRALIVNPSASNTLDVFQGGTAIPIAAGEDQTFGSLATASQLSVRWRDTTTDTTNVPYRLER